MQKSTFAKVLQGTLAGLTLAVFTAQPVRAQSTTYYFTPYTVNGHGGPSSSWSATTTGSNVTAWANGMYWLTSNSAGAFAFASGNCIPGLNGPNSANAYWNGGQMGHVAKTPSYIPGTRGFTVSYVMFQTHYASASVPAGQTASSTAGPGDMNTWPFSYVRVNLPPPNNQTPTPPAVALPNPPSGSFSWGTFGYWGLHGKSTQTTNNVSGYGYNYAGGPQNGGWSGNGTESFSQIIVNMYTVDKEDEGAMTSGNMGIISPMVSVKATANSSGNLASAIGLDVMMKAYMIN
jgi:hypothetical protein